MIHSLTCMCFGKQAEKLTSRPGYSLQMKASVSENEQLIHGSKQPYLFVRLLGKHVNVLRLLLRCVCLHVCTRKFHFARQILSQQDVLYTR